MFVKFIVVTFTYLLLFDVNWWLDKINIGSRGICARVLMSRLLSKTCYFFIWPVIVKILLPSRLLNQVQLLECFLVKRASCIWNVSLGLWPQWWVHKESPSTSQKRFGPSVIDWLLCFVHWVIQKLLAYIDIVLLLFTGDVQSFLNTT